MVNFKSPKSLTAIVHVKFHYQELEKPVTQSEIEMMSEILDHVSELNPDHRDIIINFVDYLSQRKENSQSPS